MEDTSDNKRPMPKASALNSPKLGTQSALKESKAKEITKGFYKPGDPLAIRNKDENFVYRWINSKRAIENGGIDHRGFELERTLDNTGVETTSENILDGTQRNGDLVLAKMPVEVAKARKEFYAKKQRQRDEIISIKNKMASVNGEVNYESKRGNRVTKS